MLLGPELWSGGVGPAWPVGLSGILPTSSPRPPCVSCLWTPVATWGLSPFARGARLALSRAAKADRIHIQLEPCPVLPWGLQKLILDHGHAWP